MEHGRSKDVFRIEHGDSPPAMVVYLTTDIATIYRPTVACKLMRVVYSNYLLTYRTQRIHVIYTMYDIFTYISFKFIVNIGKYTSPMNLLV